MITPPKKALLLVGSPRGEGSTSHSIGSYLLSSLESRGVKTETVNIYPALKSDEGAAKMLSAIKEADLLVLSFPLYADAPTAGVITVMQKIAEQRSAKLSPVTIKTLERVAGLLEDDRLSIAIMLISRLVKIPYLPVFLAGILISAIQDRKKHKESAQKIRNYLKSMESKEQRLVAISNSGFLEPERSGAAIAICRKFAKETGIDWAGGLAFGGGPFIDGKPLDKAGRRVTKLKQGLKIAAADLALGKDISDEASTLVSAPVVSQWFYILIAGVIWRIQGWINRTLRRLRDRPYEDE